MTILSLSGESLRNVSLIYLELGGTVCRYMNLSVKPTVLNCFLVFISVVVASHVRIDGGSIDSNVPLTAFDSNLDLLHWDVRRVMDSYIGSLVCVKLRNRTLFVSSICSVARLPPLKSKHLSVNFLVFVHCLVNPIVVIIGYSLLSGACDCVVVLNNS